MIAPARSAARVATVEDLFAIPEDERRHEHGGAQRKLAAFVDPFDRRAGGRLPGGWWCVTSVEITFDARNTFRPDVIGWRRERMPERPRGSPISVRPDWVCEILSTNKRNDLIKKKRVYHRHEVPHYWIIDPGEETLAVYRWAPDGYMEVLLAERGDEVRAEPFEVMVLKVGVLFGDEEEERADESG